MRFNKQFTVTLTIDDAIGFAADPGALRRTIEAKYESLCYGCCFINRIIEITRQGQLMIPRGSGICNARIDVMFTAECTTYSAGDVIHNAVVQKVTNSNADYNLLCIAENAYAHVLNNWKGSSIVDGQVIPLLVIGSAYLPFTNGIQVNAEVYTPSKAYKLYHIPAEIRDQTANLRELLALHNAAVERVACFDAALVDAFSLQLRAYDKPPAIGTAVRLTFGDIITAHVPVGVKYIAKHPATDRAGDEFWGYSAIVPDPYGEVCERMSYEAICTEITINHTAATELLESFVLSYSDEKMRADHANLWRLYEIARARL